MFSLPFFEKPSMLQYKEVISKKILTKTTCKKEVIGTRKKSFFRKVFILSRQNCMAFFLLES